MKTLELFALEKKEKEKVEKTCIIKDQASIESFLNSCFKEVISLLEMELVENQFMELNLKMKTSKLNIKLDVSQWLMLAQELMDLNFSLL